MRTALSLGCRSFYSGAERDEKVISEIKRIQRRNGPIEKMGIRARQRAAQAESDERWMERSAWEIRKTNAEERIYRKWIDAGGALWRVGVTGAARFLSCAAYIIWSLASRHKGTEPSFVLAKPSRALAQTLLKTGLFKEQTSGKCAERIACRKKAIASSSLFVIPYTTTAFQLLIFNSPAPPYQHVAPSIVIY